jgi:hypothetical protein
MSLTVFEMSTSPGPAAAAIRAAMSTAVPRTPVVVGSTSPVWTPTRGSRPRSDRRDDCQGAADGAGGPVEGREQGSASRVDFAAAKARELGADEPLVSNDQVVPSAVSDFACFCGGFDDVGDEQGCEYAVGL